MAIKGKKFNYKHYLRRTHRYLGVFIGVQFILWTVGGLYFSWTDLDEIHGDHLRKHKHTSLELPAETISPAIITTTLLSTIENARIEKIYVVEALGQYFYAVEHLADDMHSTRLYRVDNGELRPRISAAEAREIAKSAFALPDEPSEIEYLTAENIGKHHEYREKPMPAWALTFDNNVSVYVSAETGQIGAIRTDKWRVFDFLWMLHTMDFDGRDNFNNYVLRGFSILGLGTVLSGFLLFLVSSRLVRRLIWRSR